MGLHVTSVAQIASKAPHLQGIKYFVYVLDYYNLGGEIMDALIAEIPNLESHFANLDNAVAISSVKNIDFANEVLSWHNCLGKDASEVCPAILICTLPPHYFLDGGSTQDTDEETPWLLLQLGELCSDVDALKKLLRNIVQDIARGAPLSDFEAGRNFEHEERTIVSGKLKYLGVELDHKELFKKIGARLVRSQNAK